MILAFVVLAAVPSTAAPDPVASTAADDASDAAIADIKKLDATHYTISTRTLAFALAADRKAAGVRIVAAFRDGEQIGYELFSVKPIGLAAALGLENQDIVVSLNGVHLASPLETLVVLDALRRKPVTIELAITRRKTRITLTYTVE